MNNVKVESVSLPLQHKCRQDHREPISTRQHTVTDTAHDMNLRERESQPNDNSIPNTLTQWWSSRHDGDTPIAGDSI